MDSAPQNHHHHHRRAYTSTNTRRPGKCTETQGDGSELELRTEALTNPTDQLAYGADARELVKGAYLCLCETATDRAGREGRPARKRPKPRAGGGGGGGPENKGRVEEVVDADQCFFERCRLARAGGFCISSTGAPRENVDTHSPRPRARRASGPCAASTLARRRPI
jgi:hypothetical protein